LYPVRASVNRSVGHTSGRYLTMQDPATPEEVGGGRKRTLTRLRVHFDARLTGDLDTSVMSRKFLRRAELNKWNPSKRLAETSWPNYFGDSTLAWT